MKSPPVFNNPSITWNPAIVRVGGMLAAGAVVAAVMLIPVLIAIHAGVYHAWLDNPLNAFGMWGVYAIYVWTRPARKECLVVVGLATILRVLFLGMRHETPYMGYLVLNIGFYAAFVCAPILVYRAFKGPRQSIHRLSLGGIFLFSYVGVFLTYYTSFARIVCPQKLDYLLYLFDGALGSHVNFTFAKAASAFPALGIVLNTTYNSLGFFVSLLFAAQLSLARNKLNIIKLNIINPIVGFSLYFLYPAMGPRYAFSSFPELPGTVTASPALLAGVPNAMPSLHIATALLIFYLARPWRPLRWLTGLYLGLMVLAIFSTGEHYMVDAIVAIPYSITIFALASSTHERRTVLIVSAGLLGLWLFVLRFGAFNLWTAWGLTVTTIATGVLAERRLAKSLWSPTGVEGSLLRRAPSMHESLREATEPAFLSPSPSHPASERAAAGGHPRR